MTSLRIAAPFFVSLMIAATPALPGDDGHGHHAMVMVPEGAPEPTIALEAMEDTKDGFNLHLMTQNFEFTPAMTGHEGDGVAGHAHLYVNGTKIGRVYGNWVHVPAKLLGNGSNEIRVTLNDNMHSEWAVAGEPVAAVIEVMNHGTGHAAGHGSHDHSN